MRRDEIKPFRGNVETHIQRLGSFSDSAATPLAKESPDQDDGLRQPMLDYVSPTVLRAWVRKRLSEFVHNVVWLLALALLLAGLIVGLLPAGLQWEGIAIVAVTFLLPLGLFLAAKRRK